MNKAPEAMNQDSPSISPSALTAYFMTLAGMWVAIFLPEARLWGFNWYAFYPWYVQLGALLIGVAAPFILLRTGGNLIPKLTRGHFAIGAIAIIAVHIAAFILLRTRTHFLGDGYQVLGKVLAGPEVVKPWDRIIWMVQSGLYHAFGSGGEPTALLAMQTISIASGLIFLAVTVLVGRRLFANASDRLLFLLGMASGGYMLLYFGYVENYPLFVTAIGLTFLIGLLTVRGILARWIIIVPAALTMALHPFGLALAPALIYALLQGTKPAGLLARLSRSAKAIIIVALLLAVAGGTAYLWTTSYFFRFSFVPPWPDRFTVEGYHLFSIPHLLDFANLIFLLLPGILVLVVALADSTRRRLLKGADFRFLLLGTIGCLLLVFVVNPRLGMPRDWDLFSFAGIPLVTLTVYFLLGGGEPERRRPVLLLAVVFLGWLILWPRAVSQAIPNTSIAVFDYYAELDVAKSRNGRFVLQEYLERQGRMEEHDRRSRLNSKALPHERLNEIGRLLGQQGRYVEARDKFYQALEHDPMFHYAWDNLGVVYKYLGDLDSAITCLRIADGINPYNYSTYMNLAATFYFRERFDSAETYWKKAIAIQPKDVGAQSLLIKLYREQERWNEFDSLLDVMIRNPEAPPAVFSQATIRAFIQGDTAAAREYFDSALSRGLDSTAAVKMLDTYPALITPKR